MQREALLARQAQLRRHKSRMAGYDLTLRRMVMTYVQDKQDMTMQLLQLERQYHEAQARRKRHWQREQLLEKELKQRVETAWKQASQARK